jgi:hypothetical protein
LDYIFKIYLQTRENKILKIVLHGFSFLSKNLDFPLKRLIRFFQYCNYSITDNLTTLNPAHILRLIKLFFKNPENFFSNLFYKRNYFQYLQINFTLMSRKLNL